MELGLQHDRLFITQSVQLGEREETCSDSTDGVWDAPSQNLRRSSSPELPAPARGAQHRQSWAVTDFVHSAHIPHNTHCSRHPPSAMGHEEGRGLPGEGIRTTSSCQWPVFGCLAATSDSIAAVKCLHSQSSSYEIIFLKSRLDTHFHNKKSSFLSLLYVASKILSQSHPLSWWFTDTQ